MHSTVTDLRPFLPSKDYEKSTKFYVDLGFKLNWSNSDVCEFQVGNFRFLLQKFYVKAWAENFMMSLMVEDADVWWTAIQSSGVLEKYEGVSGQPPKVQPWDLRVLYLTDPSGVLWHISDVKTA